MATSRAPRGEVRDRHEGFHLRSWRAAGKCWRAGSRSPTVENPRANACNNTRDKQMRREVGLCQSVVLTDAVVISPYVRRGQQSTSRTKALRVDRSAEPTIPPGANDPMGSWCPRASSTSCRWPVGEVLSTTTRSALEHACGFGHSVIGAHPSPEVSRRSVRSQRAGRGVCVAGRCPPI